MVNKLKKKKKSKSSGWQLECLGEDCLLTISAPVTILMLYHQDGDNSAGVRKFVCLCNNMMHIDNMHLLHFKGYLGILFVGKNCMVNHMV